MNNNLRYRILLLDSDREYMARLAAVLEPDYDVCALDHPHTALEKMDWLMPDIIMLDADLPDMDGIKFANKIRRCAAHKRVVLVFVTMRDSIADRHLGFMVQAAMYLSKKVRPQRIALDLGIYIRENRPRIRPKSVDFEAVRAELPPLPKLPEPEPAPPPQPIAVEPPPAEKPATSASLLVTPKKLPNPLLSIAPEVPNERVRILIADSEYATVFSIDSMLSDQYNCIAATSGSEAMEKAQHYMPDVLILSMQLPEIPGYEVCQRLRGISQFGRTPILGVTRGGDPSRQECERLYGVTQVFQIPAEYDRLSRRVREIIRDPGFRRRPYPQSFNEVWAEEEHYRMLRG